VALIHVIFLFASSDEATLLNIPIPLFLPATMPIAVLVTTTTQLIVALFVIPRGSSKQRQSSPHNVVIHEFLEAQSSLYDLKIFFIF